MESNRSNVLRFFFRGSAVGLLLVDAYFLLGGGINKVSRVQWNPGSSVDTVERYGNLCIWMCLDIFLTDRVDVMNSER